METPKLTTMVVLYTMGVRLDTTKLVYELPITDKIIKIEKQGVLKRGESKKDRVRHRKPKATDETTPVRRTTGFSHNSITLVLMSTGDGSLPEKEITVKIFQNGVFHITGVLDEKYDQDVVNYLQKHITEHCSDSIVSGAWTPENRRVILMNYKTKINSIPPYLLQPPKDGEKEESLSRERLYSNVKKQGYKANYEPAVYPGVKIYFPNTRWIAKVFRTGNIILTGTRTPGECEQMTTQLANVLMQK